MRRAAFLIFAVAPARRGRETIRHFEQVREFSRGNSYVDAIFDRVFG